VSLVVAEALTWLGTPYRHQASLKGVGCDCLGLVRGVWRAVYGPEPAPIPAYRPHLAAPRYHEPLIQPLGPRVHPFPLSNAGPRPGP